MYKILVTTKNSSMQGGTSVHTLVIDFDAKGSAEQAARLINERHSQNKFVDHQSAIILFQETR